MYEVLCIWGRVDRFQTMYAAQQNALERTQAGERHWVRYRRNG